MEVGRLADVVDVVVKRQIVVDGDAKIANVIWQCKRRPANCERCDRVPLTMASVLCRLRDEPFSSCRLGMDWKQSDNLEMELLSFRETCSCVSSAYCVKLTLNELAN